MKEELAALRRALERERKARNEAEKILEHKSLELFQLNQQMKKLYKDLENRYKKIVEQANDIIYRGDEEGNCIFVNAVSEKILGYKKEELIGKHFTYLVIPEDQAEVTKFYLKQKEERTESTYKEFRVSTKNGEIVWLGQNVSLIFEDDQVIGTSGVARDITKQKEAELAVKRNEEKYRSVIENMQLGLLEVDPDGLVTKAYSKFCEMVGYSEKELVGKDPSLILTNAETKALIEAKNERRKKGKTDVYEVSCKRKDGRLIWLMISGAPRFNNAGKFMGSIGIHMDITDQKNLMSQLENAKAKAEETSEAKEQFLAHMSHEIRTPLNAVIGMTHLLEETKISEEQEDYLNTIKSSSELLLNMVSDILDLSKIESGELDLHLAPIDLFKLIDSQINIHRQSTKKKNLKVELEWNIDLAHKVEADQKFLNQVFSNLLGNAAKFTEEGFVKVVVDKIGNYPGGIKLRFTVVDSGIGMSAEQSKKVFDSFQQANYETAIEYGGSGLGLSIAKHLVNLMGGELTVESALGKGSNFSFELPFTLSDEKLGEAENETAHKKINSIEGMKVLIAEDNLVNQKFISKVLEKHKADFTLVENGEVCLKLAKEKKFELIILDIHMPKLDGYKTAESIRKSNSPNTNSPIIALTASALVTDRKKALDCGMNDYLTKPFTPLQLVEALAKFKQTPSNLSINEAYLVDFYQGDEAFEREMFEIFLKNTPKEIEKLKDFLDNGNLHGVYEIAHKIKPTFKMVGLGQIESKIGKLEKLAHVYSEEKLLAYFQKIEPLLNQAIETAKERIAKKTNPS